MENDLLSIFEKAFEEGLESQTFHHHCQEMQAWYDDAKSIKFKSNDELINSSLLVNWFFDCGGNTIDFMKNLTEDKEYVYYELMNAILYTYKVYESFIEVLKNYQGE